MPATRGCDHGPRVVLEHPACEVATGPRSGARGLQRSASDGRLGQERDEDPGHTVVGNEFAPNVVSVLRTRFAIGQQRLGSESAGEDRLSDALAGHRVGDSSGVADEHGARPGQRHPPDSGGDRPGLVGPLRPGVRAECFANMWTVEKIRPERLHVANAVVLAASLDPEADVRPIALERERPGVAREKILFEPDDEFGGGPRADVLVVLPEGMPLAPVAVDRQAEELANRRPHAVGGDDVLGPERFVVEDEVGPVFVGGHCRQLHALVDDRTIGAGHLEHGVVEVDTGGDCSVVALAFREGVATLGAAG